LNVSWPAVAFVVLPLAALALLWKQWRGVSPGRPVSTAQSSYSHHGAGPHENTFDATLDSTAELMTADGYRYGLDDDQLDAHPATTATRATGNATRSTGRRPFDLLREAHGRDIASLLAGEQPQTIAVIVGHLPPDQAAEVVDALPAPLQADVLGRVMHLEAAAPEVLHDIEAALAARVAELAPRAADGWNTTQQILAAGGPEFAARMARRLAPHDQHLAAQFDHAAAHTPATHVDHHAASAPGPGAHETPWAFEELDRLSEADLRYVAAAANHDLLELALAGATPELAERVLRALAPDQSRALRNRLDRLAPTRMSDITQAQRELARLAFELLAATRDSATTGTRLVA
jgi:flagellar motor switch protein FliG